MKTIGLCLLSFLLMACNDIEGVLKLSEAIQFNTKYNGTVTMEAGDYDVKLSHDKKSRYIKVEFPNENDDGFPPGEDDDWRDDSYEVRFKYSSSTIIPEDNGEFLISHIESGQNVDLYGSVKTTIQKGGLTRDWERCTYRERRTHCFPDRNGRTICDTYWDEVWGRRDVEFYPVTTDKTLNVVLTKPASDVSSANMNIHQVWTDRDYTYVGICR
ncbi:MAG: hypothetical protein KDD58_01855 [Bdellovibrionales bacterium]|nr:hypothetical protein [Bdellovibrionales bacterium]